jgi:hypothetical protein
MNNERFTLPEIIFRPDDIGWFTAYELDAIPDRLF